MDRQQALQRFGLAWVLTWVTIFGRGESVTSIERDAATGVGWDFGPGGSLKHTFFPEPKLLPGHYRFACRVRGTAGLPVAFEVADGGRALSRRKTISLSPDWQEHVVEFAIEAAAAREETSLRFILPRDTTGEFALTDSRLRKLD